MKKYNLSVLLSLLHGAYELEYAALHYLKSKLILLIALMVTVSSGGVYSAGGRSITDSDTEVAGSEEVIDIETYEGEEAEEEKKESGRIEVKAHEWVRFLDSEGNLIREISLGRERERVEPVGAVGERYNRILRQVSEMVSDNGKYVCVGEELTYDFIDDDNTFPNRARGETKITLYDNSGRELFQWKKDYESAKSFWVSDSGVVAVHVGISDFGMNGPVYVFSRTGEQLLKYPREGEWPYPDRISGLSPNGRYLAMDVGRRAVFFDLINGTSHEIEDAHAP